MRIRYEISETIARVQATQSELVTHIATSRTLIAESRELLAHADRALNEPLDGRQVSRRSGSWRLARSAGVPAIEIDLDAAARGQMDELSDTPEQRARRRKG